MRRWAIVAAAGIAAVSVGRTLHAQCAPWEPHVNLSSSAGRYAVDSHMAIDAGGNVHVIYQDFIDTSGRNYYTHNTGGMWSAPLNLGNMGGKGSTPKIMITPDQWIHVFYGKNDLYWRTRAVSGGSWSAPVQLGHGGSFITHVAMTDAGDLYFMYGHLFDPATTPRNGVWGMHKPLAPEGNKTLNNWAAPEVIAGGSDDGNWPLGNYVAAHGNTVWAAIGWNRRLYYKKKTIGSAWPGGAGTEFFNKGGGLRFAWSPVGNEMAGAFFYDVDGNADAQWYEVFMRYSYDGGNTWTAPENLSNGKALDRNNEICYDASGNLHLIWQGFGCDGCTPRLRYRSRIAGLWSPTETLTPSVSAGTVADAILSHGNRILFTYSATGPGVIGLYDVFLTGYTPTQPKITLTETSFARLARVGAGLPPQSLGIANSCYGTMNYTVSTGAGWLSVSPGSGSVASGIDTITVSYVADTLRAGVHQTSIQVTANAWNSPQVIPVTLTLQTVAPDFDGDGDVDQDDFGVFQKCLGGPAVQPAPECARCDLAGDLDVDHADFELMLACWSGAGNLAEASCAATYP